MFASLVFLHGKLIHFLVLRHSYFFFLVPLIFASDVKTEKYIF